MWLLVLGVPLNYMEVDIPEKNLLEKSCKQNELLLSSFHCGEDAN